LNGDIVRKLTDGQQQAPRSYGARHVELASWPIRQQAARTIILPIGSTTTETILRARRNMAGRPEQGLSIS